MFPEHGRRSEPRFPSDAFDRTLGCFQQMLCPENPGFRKPLRRTQPHLVHEMPRQDANAHACLPRNDRERKILLQIRFHP